MKTVAIVSEYNPFHNGHAYQIAEIKRFFGEDTVIIAIMSGNYVQRGDVAILGKFQRARMALECGVSLVLELPFPFSLAGAERFASAAIELAHKLGVVDVLSFGSESGNIELLCRTADNVSSPDFNTTVKELLKSDEYKAKGYASVRTLAYEQLYGKEAAVALTTPNNILAIEYIKALKHLKSPIVPHTILRSGTDKDSPNASLFAGATYLRALILEGKWDAALHYIPSEAHTTLHEAYQNGDMPVALNNLSASVLAYLRLEERTFETAECSGGLYERLRRVSKASGSLDELWQKAATKKYTDARIRRAAIFSYLGVTPAHLRESVLYTQVLAMDGKGQAVLHHIRKTAGISILTKPADIGKLPAQAKEQASRAYRADSVYTLAMPKPKAEDAFLAVSPYRK